MAPRHSLGRPSSALSMASSTEENQDMWSSMLSSVASSKRLPQKNILVLGGTSEGQREFVEALSSGHRRSNDKKPPLANSFALGYTYLDVLDSDHEDVLARLSVYLISKPQPQFVPLLKPLFTPETLPETLVCVLLDWQRPWEWMRELKEWIKLLRGIFRELDDVSRMTLDEVNDEWKSRRSTYADAGGGTEITLPLGPGEFDEPIGLPLCVVCQNADKIEVLEKERGWKDNEFDFILQFMRTILLKHGASLICTTPSVPSQLQPLLFSMLSIPQTRIVLKHNIIERDKVIVPPHWDSWGKIRVLREGFDVEGISSGWSIDIDPSSSSSYSTSAGDTAADYEAEGGALVIYEDVVKDPKQEDGLTILKTKGIEVPPVDTQEFLAQQLEVLEAKRAEEVERNPRAKNDMSPSRERSGSSLLEGERVREHVGPVQFNVGGIQVDADDMLKRLKDRDATLSASTEFAPSSTSATEETNIDSNKASQFFNALLMRPRSTPTKNQKA